MRLKRLQQINKRLFEKKKELDRLRYLYDKADTNYPHDQVMIAGEITIVVYEMDQLETLKKLLMGGK